MTNQSDTSNQLRRALQTIKDLRTRLEQAEQTRHEPIAVIGVACRFPGGGTTPRALWEGLMKRVNGISQVPADRWDVDELYDPDADQPGKVSTRWGGFLPDIDRFDAGFFGISPREAARMDPQQRLILEVAWEALEDAGLPLEKIAGSRAGVFVGLHSHSADYYLMQLTNLDEIDIYTGTGTSHSVVSGRISYLFDLHGPSIALDTACSSSLAAVHLAVQNLQAGESDLALAGGVNLMLTPEFTMVASRMRMMASDGFCKAFDASGDGFVRSEGSGLVILKRLSDAERDGDQILAVIRGSAANQDGKSNGLTAPNGLAQQAVIRTALANAGVRPEQVSYVETHGTGTPLGDPIEVEALAEVYGKKNPAGLPLVIGSIKSNLGHMEGAAGVGGLIKTVLALHHRTIPANLHFREANPHLSLAGTRLEIAADDRDWDTGGERRLAGVSAFGWSGTNVHMVLEDYRGQASGGDKPEKGESGTGKLTLLPISARSPEALRALASSYRSLLGEQVNVADLCFSAATRRSHLTHRLAAAGRTAADLSAALDAYLNEQDHPGLATGQAVENHQPGVVFVFPGQGGQWAGMGRQLLESSPVFRETIEACEQAFKPFVDWSLLEQLTAPAESSRLEEIDVIQPCLFAVQVGLAADLRARGLTPDAVVGHSMGEAAAAFVSGALSLEDAARVICTRSRLMKRVSGKGAMASVGLTLEQADQMLEGYRDRLSVAVSNGPTATVISGDPGALEEVLARLEGQKIFTRRVKVDVAAHSPQMEPLRGELVAALSSLRPRPTAIPLYSTVLGSRVNGTELDAEYWGRNLRQPVLFAATIEPLIESGFTVWVESGPHPVLLTAVGQADRPESHPNASLALLPAMRRGEDEVLGLQTVLAGYYSAGGSLDWNQVLPERGRYIPLPLYPWQRKRYWVKTRQADPLASWFYTVDWIEQPRPEPEQPGTPGTWLVFVDHRDRSGQGQGMIDQLAARGCRVVQVTPGMGFAQTGPDCYQVNPGQPGDFKRVLSEACGDPSVLQGAVYCWGLAASTADQLDLAGLRQAQQEVVGGALHLSQALSQASWKAGAGPRLWILTRSAQPVAGSRPVGLAQAPLWGFGRVLAFEHSDLWGGLIDLDAESQLPIDELFGPGDQQLGYRAGKRYQAQLIRQSIPPSETGGAAIRPDASYLITGGLGGLGLKVARWLAGQGARHLVLMGRSRGSDAARQAVAQLVEEGIQVLQVQGDSSSAEDVQRILSEIGVKMPPLRGIIHSAGLIEDAMLENQTWAGFERTGAAKISGAWNLHQATLAMELDFFVLFSSSSSLLGVPGQANYASANAFLDALVFERRASGLPALSINWGAWGEVGLASQQERPAILTRMGIDSFSPTKGLAALGRLMGQAHPQVMAGLLHWDKFLAQRPNGESCGFYAGLSRAAAQPAAAETDSAEPASLLQQLEAADPETRSALLTTAVQEIVTNVLRYEGSQALAVDQGFFQLGMDSMMAVELKNHLQKTFGRTLRTTLAFDYPSVNQLSRYLLGELFPEQPEAVPAGPGSEEVNLDNLSSDELKSMLDDELRRYEKEA